MLFAFVVLHETLKPLTPMVSSYIYMCDKVNLTDIAAITLRIGILAIRVPPFPSYSAKKECMLLKTEVCQKYMYINVSICMYIYSQLIAS